MRLVCRWLDLLDTQGTDVTDEELLSYITESSMMSKTMDEYEGEASLCDCPAAEPDGFVDSSKHVQGARAAPSPQQSGWGSSWETPASRTRA